VRREIKQQKKKEQEMLEIKQENQKKKGKSFEGSKMSTKALVKFSQLFRKRNAN